MRLAPGLHRVGNDLVAFYLIDDGTGVTVIDAGVRGQWRDLLRELHEMGRTVDDIAAVLLTHGDEDHIGVAERLRRDHGVPVWVHRDDAGRAKGEGKPATAWGRFRVGPLVRFLWFAGRKGAMRPTFLTEVRTVVGGETLAVPGNPTVVPMPGHSPGSVAFHVPALRALAVGDALTTRHVLSGATGPGPAPFTDEPAQAAASLAALEGIDADWILPGHGAPWRGSPGEAARLYREAAAGA